MPDPGSKPRKGSSAFFGVATGRGGPAERYFLARPSPAQATVHVAPEACRDRGDGGIDLRFDQRPLIRREGEPIGEALLVVAQRAPAVDVEEGH